MRIYYILEFSLNRREKGGKLSEFMESDKSLGRELGVNLKILSVPCWCSGSISISYTRGCWFE